jgi:hypothetical protein
MYLVPGILIGLLIPVIFVSFSRERISGSISEWVFLETIFLFGTALCIVGAFSTRLIVSQSGIEEQQFFVFRKAVKWLELRAIAPSVLGMVSLWYEQRGRAKAILISYYIDDWQNNPLLESIKQNASDIFIEESLLHRVNIPLFARSGIIGVGLLIEFILCLPLAPLITNLLTAFTALMGLARFNNTIPRYSFVAFAAAAFSNGFSLFSFADSAVHYPKGVEQRALLIYANPYICWIVYILLVVAGYSLTSHFLPRQLTLVDLILRLVSLFMGGLLPLYLNRLLLEHQLKRAS